MKKMTQVKGKIAFNLIKKAKTEELPKGSAVLALENLDERYKRKTQARLVVVEKEYTNAMMRQGAEPDNFIPYLEEKRNQLEELGKKLIKTLL